MSEPWTYKLVSSFVLLEDILHKVRWRGVEVKTPTMLHRQMKPEAIKSPIHWSVLCDKSTWQLFTAGPCVWWHKWSFEWHGAALMGSHGFVMLFLLFLFYAQWEQVSSSLVFLFFIHETCSTLPGRCQHCTVPEWVHWIVLWSFACSMAQSFAQQFLFMLSLLAAAPELGCGWWALLGQQAHGAPCVPLPCVFKWAGSRAPMLDILSILPSLEVHFCSLKFFF